MNRYRAYWPTDDAPLKDGDSGFVGVDERTDADLLPPGMVASATNCRFRNGRVEPRPGITILPWMKADGRTPFSNTTSMSIWKVSPPAGYGSFIGTGAPFASDGANDAVVGVRLGEIQNVLYAEVLLDGDPGSKWSSANAALYPVGFLVNGVLATTAYTSSLNLSAQSFSLTFSLNSIGGVLANHYIQVNVVCTSGTRTGYLTYVT